MSKWLRTGTRMLTIEIAILALFIVPAAIYAAATISKTPTTNSPTSLQSGLVGHWTFDGGDMLANVADKSGQGNAGRLIGFTATTTVAGTVGGALAFNGTSNYVSVSSSVNTSAVSFWVKPSSATNYILDLDGGTHYVWINNGIVTATGFSSPTIYVNNAVTSAIAPNVWSHVVVTTGTSFSASAITLGKQSSNYFAGSLDDTRLYNRVLSADEIKRLYGLGATTHVAVTPKSGLAAVTQVSGLSNGLVAHWTFDGQKLLQNVADSTGSGNHGRLISFPATSTAVVSGPIGQALKFDGVNDGIWTQTHAFGSKPQGTATFWFKALAYGGGEFIYEDGNSYNNFSAALGSGATDPLLFYLGSNSNTVTTTKSNFLLGEWYHVAITWNGTNTITYVDGVLDKSNVRSNVPNTTAGLETQLGRTAYGSPVSPTVGNYFKGTMDDVRVYNRALSATEIKRLYELGATTHVAVTPQSGLAAVTQASGLSNGLVAHWTFDGPKLLQNATDSSGTGNTGRLIGFTSTTTTLGPIGQALTFDGSNDYITIGDQASLESLSAITVSAWVKPNQLAADAVIAGKGVVASIVWQLWQDDVGSVSGRTDEYSFAVGSGGGTLSRAEGATNSVVAGKWTHVVGVWEQSPEHVYIYVDGVLSQSDTSLQSLTMPNTSSAVRIGDDLTDGTNAYSGSMDDVRVYNRALSAAEVLRLYQLGK